MHATDRSPPGVRNGQARRARAAEQGPPVRHLDVVLKPLSWFELSEIHIGEAALVVGRFEQPFASCGSGIRSMLSRQHARIFREVDFVYLADLGSKNGTMVNRVAVGQAPCQLRNGDEICFGGALSYRVQIAPRAAMAEGVPSASVASPPSVEDLPAGLPPNDRTRFMAAPTSFLEIFCVGSESKDDAAPADPASAAAGAPEPAIRRRPRGRVMLLLSELAALLASDEPDSARRRGWKAGAVAGMLGALVLTAHFWNASERDLTDAFARGQYGRAAELAGRLLDAHPDRIDLKARATEAALEANVPAWLAKVRGRDFDAAEGVLAGMSQLATRDADLRHLVDELRWLGDLEHLVSARGGPQAPIRIYADEAGIERLVGRWTDDTDEHQHALVRIASYVPQFGDWYGQALTHVRRLQSESAVYLPVIERLKATITTELDRDDPQALVPVLNDAAQKYPGLGGLDSVRQDLARYIEIRQEAHTPKSGRLFALLRKARFATPPFDQSQRALAASGQLPSADLLQQYEAATQAWRDGRSSESFADLQKMMTVSPWGEAAAEELERRRGVAARFAALQESRDAGGFVDQLLAFRGSLDADEDVYYLRATAADLNQQRGEVLARAQDAMNRARASWQEYRGNGPIDASQRIETSISDQFRTRARLLADASRYAQLGFLICSQVDASAAAQWAAIRDQIESEARRQRSALRDLGNIVEPGLLKAKLSLLGDSNE